MREDICQVMNSKGRLYIYMRLYIILMAHRIIFIKTGFIPLQENTQSFYLFTFAMKQHITVLGLSLDSHLVVQITERTFPASDRSRFT